MVIRHLEKQKQIESLIMYNFYENDELGFVLVTDTHFGRTFKDGVPLDRRGEYEEKIYSDFSEFLNSKRKKIIIHSGDLFESPFVSNEVLIKVYDLLTNYLYLENEYYFIAGNHDLSKDETKQKYSSFHILSELMKGYENVHFVEDNAVVVRDKIMLVPYNHFKNVEEVISEKMNENIDCVIGHFDDPVPQSLCSFNKLKLSGHIHKRHTAFDGTLFIGSFYPISFGEETDNSVMETMTLEEYNKRSDGELKDKRVRILLMDGEELPSQFSCLQLIGKKLDISETVTLEVKTEGDFDFKELFFDVLKDCKIVNELWNRYSEMKGKAYNAS